MKITFKLGSLLIGSSLTVASLTGCVTVNSHPGNNNMPGMNHGLGHSMYITDKQSFAAAMIPHHQQAIDMSSYAITNTANSEVLALAAKITSEQGPEIIKMTPWLDGKSLDYMMMMDGMLSPIQLSALRSSKDEDFDKLYIQYMVQHHEGAIKMAADALKVDDKELTNFANEIIVTQSAEIEELVALLKK
jgi:uncharacterized protein (DUF305 family)